MEELPHLFDRFYKGKNAAKDSAGIGLAISRSIIANQNGSIRAENAPHGGARFTVKFYA
ncbi:Signal transduction histidine-protein kinase BaeS [compost metagenome]